MRGDWIDDVKRERENGIKRPLDQSQHKAVNSRYPGTTLEYCYICGEPTGRAGWSDDSLFDGEGNGPFCEECWQKRSTP